MAINSRNIPSQKLIPDRLIDDAIWIVVVLTIRYTTAGNTACSIEYIYGIARPNVHKRKIKIKPDNPEACKPAGITGKNHNKDSKSKADR